MDEYDVTWKCPECGSIIPNSLYMMRKDFDKCCKCGKWYWEFDKFTLDRNDEILVDIETRVEQVIGEMIKDSYSEGYYNGYRKGDLEGYDRGYFDAGRC